MKGVRTGTSTERWREGVPDFRGCNAETALLYTWIQSAGEEHQKEMEGLQKKLRWYVENQQWLDKDAALLRQKDAEIAQLTDKLRQLRTDVSWFM